MHTKGPWMAAAKPSSVVGWPVVSQSGRVVCNVASGGDDARLIAAAPCLLEALEVMVEFDRQSSEPGHYERTRKARNALAKAKGET